MGFASLFCSFMLFPAGVAIPTQTLSSNVWSRRECVLSFNRVRAVCSTIEKVVAMIPNRNDLIDQAALGDEDSPTTTEITDLYTNGKGKNKRGFHAGSFPTDQLDVQLGTW